MPRVGNIRRLTGSLKVTPTGAHQSPADWDRILLVWFVFHFLLVKFYILGWVKIVVFFLSHFQPGPRVINSNTITERKWRGISIKVPHVLEPLPRCIIFVLLKDKEEVLCLFPDFSFIRGRFCVTIVIKCHYKKSTVLKNFTQVILALLQQMFTEVKIKRHYKSKMNLEKRHLK